MWAGDPFAIRRSSLRMASFRIAGINYIMYANNDALR